MSMVGVRYLLPSPQSPLYQFPPASSQTAWGQDSRHPGGKMSLHSGIAGFSLDNPQVRTEDDQRDPSEVTPKGEERDQYSGQGTSHHEPDQSHNAAHHSKEAEESQHAQRQTSQEWNQGANSTGFAKSVDAEHDPDVSKEENDVELAEDLSNGEDATGDHVLSNSDPGADKRKTKRFRLTHNQTRFLMSEFTRQAHPDAAHRERLSREIPGLSPRQVQVWFQNRRAKLKRLTSQDRDRVLKSRALPEHFDRAQMLHHPYNSKSLPGPASSSIQTGRPSSASGGSKPLALSTIKRGSTDDYPISPASATTSAYGNYITSPASAGIPGSISPTSNTGNGLAISGTGTSLPGLAGLHQSQSHGYARSHSFSTSYAGSWQQYHSQRMHLPPSDSGSKHDSLNTALRPGPGYHELGGSMSDASSYGRQSSLASSAGQGAQNDGPLQSSLAYQGQPHHTQSEPFTSSTQAVTESHGGYSPASFRQIPPLQTAHLPPLHDYQVSPFTPSFNYESFYQYAQDNTSAVSLPASYMRSETSYESPSGYSYENDLNKFATSHTEGAR